MSAPTATTATLIVAHREAVQLVELALELDEDVTDFTAEARRIRQTLTSNGQGWVAALLREEMGARLSDQPTAPARLDTAVKATNAVLLRVAA